MKSKVAGIYKIENSVSHKVYVGQSIDVRRRWKAHIRALSSGSHKNRYLQRAWDKDGQSAFSFALIEECESREELNERETYWAERYSGRSYNLGATGLEGTMSAETREKIKAAHIGKKLSEEHKRKISESCAKKRYTEAEKRTMRLKSTCVKAIFCPELCRRFFSLGEAERELGVKRSGICHALKHQGKTAGKIDGVRLHWRYEQCQ